MTTAPLRPAERLLVAALDERGSGTRAGLARATGLPGSTVVSLVAKLLADGVLVESPAAVTAHGRAGRPAKLLSLAGPRGLVAAVAVSRHEVRAGAVGLDGTLRAAAARPLESLEVPDVVTPALAVLDEALASAGLDRTALTGAVMGVPGPFRRGEGVVPLRDVPEPVRRFFPGSLSGWMRSDPAPDLARALGVPAVAENDANLGALGEATHGAARGGAVSLYLKFAQGLGAGIVVGGRPLRGASGHAGELAHVGVADDGPVCGCGRPGCLAMTTGPELLLHAMKRSYRDATALDDLIALAEHGDRGVVRLLHDAGRLVGRPLADLCTVLNPHAVVVDGRLGAAAGPLVEGIREAVDRYALAPAAEAVRIVPGELGADAELVGAAVLARQEAVSGPLFPGGDHAR